MSAPMPASHLRPCSNTASTLPFMPGAGKSPIGASYVIIVDPAKYGLDDGAVADLQVCWGVCVRRWRRWHVRVGWGWAVSKNTTGPAALLLPKKRTVAGVHA